MVRRAPRRREWRQGRRPLVEYAVSMAEGAGRYLGDGILHISIANVIIILVGVGLFVAALLVPFPKGHGDAKGGGKK